MKRSAAATPVRKLGPYQLGLLLGEGGMGEVYKAFDDRLDRWVAAKRVRGDSTQQGRSGRARQRFRREARTLAQLGHPAIVQIFDIVEDDEGDWIVMELIDGPTLAELRWDGPLEPGLVLDYGRQIASALAAAHTSGVVHRDLKTENVMLLPTGHIKVLDFGVARRVASSSLDRTLPGGIIQSDPHVSRPGRVVGTPRAMSPEQAIGRDVDARSDLFSFGVLLYEILTSRSPFAARSLEETLRRVATHHPPSAQRLCPGVPQQLSELVDRLLEKDPASRPPTAAAVEQELVAIQAQDPSYLVTSWALSQVETIEPIARDSRPQGSHSQGSHSQGGLPQDAPPQDSPLQNSSARGTASQDGTSEVRTACDSVVVTTLLVSDLVGSTQLVEELGDREAAALFRRHDRLARDLLELHGGREIDKTDGFLLLFDRPWQAVSYALAYHAGLDELHLGARVGIHLGEVILHRNSASDVQRGAKPIEVEGLAKPTAARLMSLAKAGQTLLTRAAHDVARRSAASEGDAELQWPAHGSYRFKGITGEVEIFEVGMEGTAPLTPPTSSDKVQRLNDSPSLSEKLQRARLDLEPRALQQTDVERASVTLRSWPPPELPEQPYPVLLPYSHPSFLAGRDGEISHLWRLLEMPIPILGLSAPSGTGKSSLLAGGLVPLLRAAGIPVASERHPAEAGLAARLIGDLLEGAELPADNDSSSFVARLSEVESLAGVPPVLVLDQFEDLLDDDAAATRAMLGTLMAASIARRPGLAAPPCRWLVAYRREYFGQLRKWLGDVLVDARLAGVDELDVLPHDLSGPDRFHSVALSPLATAPPGVEDSLAESTRVFLAAIETPLTAGLSPHFPCPPKGDRESINSIALPDQQDETDLDQETAFTWYFPPGHAERLAGVFAQARVAHPEAPLTPELQVVLAHLLAQAGPNGEVTVPDDPSPLIDRALEDHLQRALQRAFPADTKANPTRRARALLALRELASSTGRRDEGLRPEELARAIGDDGEAILEQLATPFTRLVRIREAPDGLRWVLSHDRMAEAVVRLVEQEGRQGRLVIDGDLLALRRLVTLRTELFCSGEVQTATQISRHRIRRIESHSEALLWDDQRRAWFTACRRQSQKNRRRFVGLVSLAVLVLSMIGWGAWSWSERLAKHRTLLEQVARGEPSMAFQALHVLASRPDVDASELLQQLKQRDVPMDVLEWGLGGLEEPQRSAAVLQAVEMALPWVEETQEDPKLIANLVWALDFASARDPALTARAQELRDQVLEPLRRSRPPPPLPEPEDPDWIHVPSGSFLMGTGPDEEGQDDERPQHEVRVAAFRLQRHEVTVADYRRLIPDHQPEAADDLPAAYISWYAAYTYAAWLGGRLPTEAEWEYAARAGCPFAYCTRNGQETQVDVVAWTLRTSTDATSGERGAQPVMGLEPNAWGLYDILGNLWEWTAEGDGEYPEEPQADSWARAATGGRRAFRGGSFWGQAPRSRVANRSRDAPGVGNEFRGLRVLLGAPSQVAPSPW